MFIFSSIFSNWWFWSVNYTSLYENSEWKVPKNIKFLSEISNDSPNDLLGTNIYKILESSW